VRYHWYLRANFGCQLRSTHPHLHSITITRRTKRNFPAIWFVMVCATSLERACLLQMCRTQMCHAWTIASSMQVGRMISSDTSERTDWATLVGEVTEFVGEINSKLDPIQFLLLQSSLLLQQTNTISAGQIQKMCQRFSWQKIIPLPRFSSLHRRSWT
jgi:hypothetical protein